MITIFNRAQLLATADHNRFLDVIDNLKKNNIEYSVRIETAQLSVRNKKYGLGNLYDSSRTHIVYVRKKDVQKANYILNEIV